MSDEKKITVTRDGPYVVTGKIPLAEELIICDEGGTPVRWEPGLAFPERESYELCRCGQSGNKPFCDGSHVEAGFRDEGAAPREDYFEAADVTAGPGIALFDLAALCIRAGFCHRGGNVWQLAATRADADAVDVVIEDARDCPSGRLVAAWQAAPASAIEPPLEPAISLVEIPRGRISGPLWVRGQVPIESIEGWLYEARNRVTLCRCGHSRNKPFCDGTHARIGFNDGSPAVTRKIGE